MYNIPINNGITFKFDSSGYAPPDFNDVNFKFSAKMNDLKMTIVGSELQRDYLKSCRTYVIGYNKYNIQILKESCTYGGIRDLYFSLKCDAAVINLGMYIKPTIRDYADLTQYLKSFEKSTAEVGQYLKSFEKSTADVDLYLKQVYSTADDVSKYIKSFERSTTDTQFAVKLWFREVQADFSEYIKSFERDTASVDLYLKQVYSVDTYVEKYIKSFERDTTEILFAIKLWFREIQTNFSEYIKSFERASTDIDFYMQPLRYSDLHGFLQPLHVSDFSNIIKGIKRETPVDIGFYAKQTYPLSSDVGQYVHPFKASYTTAQFAIKSWFREEPVDFSKYLKSFESNVVDFYKYVKPTIKDSADFNLDVFKIWQYSSVDLVGTAHGWQAEDVLFSMASFHYSNFPMTLRATYISDLTAVLYAIRPVDIKFDLVGWYASNFTFETRIVRSPYDFNFVAVPVPSSDLNLSLYAKKGIFVPDDVTFSLSSYYQKQINFSLNTVPHVNLGMDIFSSGDSTEFKFQIYPKVVYVRTYIIVSYLENKDISFSVNYPCFGSDSSDFLFEVTIPNSSYVRSSIFGYDGCNIQDMSFGINTSTYIECSLFPLSVKNYAFPKSNLELNVSKDIPVMCENYLDLSVNLSNYNVTNYVKTPEANEFVGASRFIEELPIQNNVVGEYKVDRSLWEVQITTSNYTSLVYVYGDIPLNDDTSAFVSSAYNSYGRDISVVTTVFPAVKLNSFYYRASASHEPGFSKNHYIYVKTNEEDAWTFITELSTIGKLNFEALVDVSSFGFIIGRIKILTEVQYYYFQFHEICAFTYIDPYVTESNIRIVEDFEEPLGDSWANYELSILDSPSKDSYSLGSDGTILPNKNYGDYSAGYAVFSPNILYFGIEVDFLEFYYYIGSTSTSFPVVALITRGGNKLFSVSTSSNGSLVRFHNDEWLLVSDTPTSGFDSWYVVRLDFSWETRTVDLSWSDVNSNELVIYNDLAMNSYTQDLCIGGSYFACRSGSYFAGPEYCFDDIPFSRAWESAVSVDTTIYVGYSFSASYALKRIRIMGYFRNFPLKFKIRAGTKRPSSNVGYETEGDLLCSVDELGNVDYWKNYEWKEYYLDNPNNKEYSVFWLVIPASDYYGNISIHEFEVLGTIDYSDYSLKEVEFHLHNQLETTSYYGDDVWGNGWCGRSSDFRIDKFLIQDMDYKEVVDRDTSDIQFSIVRYPIATDMPCSIKVHNNISRVDKTIKNKLIVLSLTDGREDWRKYVKLSFSNYIQEYVYFTGNKSVYKTVAGTFWEVRVEGYSLTNLPTGIEKGKVRVRYLFNLSRYNSIDEAIREMVARVTEFCEADVGFSLTAITPNTVDLAFSLNAIRPRKSNRTVGFDITVV